MDYKTFVNLVGNDVVNKYGQEEIKRILNDSYDLCLGYLKMQSSLRVNVADFSAYELEALDEATYEQAKYIIANGGNLATLSGYDRNANSFLSQEEINKRIISPRAKDFLARTRYAYRGIR